MTKRIFLSNIITAFWIVLLSSSLLTWVAYSHSVQSGINELLEQNKIIARSFEHMGVQFLRDCTPSLRLTLISNTGEVLYDSHEDIQDMDNHLDRSEVQQAIRQGSGSSVRKSETLLSEQVYVATLLNDGNILRASKEQGNLLSFFVSIVHPLTLVLCIAVALSFFIASSLSRSIMKPLTNLDLDHPLENPSAYEEITPLLRKIQKQYSKIDRQLGEIAHKKEEFDIITRNMAEGLLLLDSEGHILSLNESASRLFQVEKETCLGKNILTLQRSVALQEILKKAFLGETTEGTLQLNQEEVYQINASPILQEGELSGLALLFMNTTEKNESEKIRREFSANVSHELKTPLHSISGCAELLSHNLVQEQDIPVFAQQIYSEAQRLIRLVEEIISLSRLEEGVDDLMVDQVDLYSVSKEVLLQLKDMAKVQNIQLNLQGDSAVLKGNYHLLSALVRNLCENAIKYNRPDGFVEVTVEDDTEHLRLRVKDSGIGVSEKDKPLIFQRFYRVDKSRSKENGGTGLGLSIVKHSVKLHKGKLSMESTLDVGSSITVEFPKEI